MRPMHSWRCRESSVSMLSMIESQDVLLKVLNVTLIFTMLLVLDVFCEM